MIIGHAAMDSFDTGTLVAALIIAQAATTLALFAMLRFARYEPALHLWMAHKVLIAVGLLSLYFRADLPTVPSILMTNAAIMIGYSCLWAGARVFNRRPVVLWAHVLPVLAVFGVVCWFTFGDDSALHRLVWSCGLYGAYSTLSGLEYLRGERGRPRATGRQRLVGGVQVTMALVYGVVIFSVPLDPRLPSVLEAPQDAMTLLWVWSFFADTAYAMGILTLNYERLHQRNARTSAHLRRVLDEQKQFMLMLSHEVKNPLASINRSAEFIESELAPLPETLSRRFDNIRDRVRVLDRLVDTFLRDAMEQSMVENGDPRPMTLGDLWALTREGLDPGIATDRMRVQVEDPDVTIKGHPMLLANAVGALLDNAVKYSSGDSPVTVCLRRDGEVVTITVIDEGIGIPRAEMPQIVRRFYRGSNARTKPGTGLGLAMARWAAARHGGGLDLESEEGRGTVATLRLPLAERRSGRIDSLAAVQDFDVI